MKGAPMKVTVEGSNLSGPYLVAEQRDDGTLVLKPERELLSEVASETDGQVFHDDDFIAHLKRVAEAEDDLPPLDQGELWSGGESEPTRS